MAVTSLLLGEGLPKVVGLPEQEDPNNPAEPHIQAVFNRTAIQARRACIPIPRFASYPASRAAKSCARLVFLLIPRHLNVEQQRLSGVLFGTSRSAVVQVVLSQADGGTVWGHGIARSHTILRPMRVTGMPDLQLCTG